MKKLKENKGFTLVELIVVIAILGILAAVAVPAYSGYVDKAKEAGDITQLESIRTAAVSAVISSGNVSTVKVTTSDGAVTKVEVDSTTLFQTAATAVNEDNFMQYLTGNSAATSISMTMDSTKYKTGTFTWTANTGDWS